MKDLKDYIKYSPLILLNGLMHVVLYALLFIFYIPFQLAGLVYNHRFLALWECKKLITDCL